ncbi:MAG: ABC transporter ATP-binding protein [Nitrososphaerota archaeon]
MSLEAYDIVSGYGKMEILHGVSLKAEKSKITAFIGPNGAGKSTLLKTIYGFIKPWKGQVIFDNEDVTNLDPDLKLKKGIAYVLQGRNIFPYMTVLENLQIAAYTWKDRSKLKEKIKSILERFPILKGRENQLAGNLSGGEQRILELGRVLMLSPKAILFDEPTLGLAPKVIDELYEKILELNKEDKITFLIVEQNVRKVLSVADYVYVLELGKNKLEGKANELLENEGLRKTYLGY